MARRDGYEHALRVRRRADGALAAVSLAAISIVVAIAAGFPRPTRSADRDLAVWLSAVPKGLGFTTAAVIGLACFGLTVAAAFGRARRDLRYLLTGSVALAAALVVTAVSFSVGVRYHGGISRVLHTSHGPVLAMDAALVAFLVGSETVRRGSWRRWTGALAVIWLLSGLVDRAVRVVDLVLAVFTGLFLGAAARWALRASSLRPSRSELLAWLGDHGIDVGESGGQAPRSRDCFDAVLSDGTLIRVSVADRESRLTGMFRRIWAVIRLRSPVAGHVTLASRARLEEIALSCCLAEKAGVRAPVLRLLEPVQDRTLVMVTRQPEGSRTPGPLTAAVATELFASLRALHAIGVAHRDLRPQALITEPEPAFSSLDDATPAASGLARRLDVAQLLTTVGRSIGSDAAVQALRDGYGEVDGAAVASVLQPLALAPWGWSAMRAAGGCLSELRDRLAGPGATVPLARLERFRWRTVVTVAALVLAGYVVAGQIGTINLAGALGHMSALWFSIALGASAVTYWAAAANLDAFVPKRLSLTRASLVQLSTSFVGVAMPSTLGYVALNARYLSRENIDQGSIAVAITLSQASNAVTSIIVVIALALLTGSGAEHVNILPGTDVAVGAGVIAAILVVLAAVPQTRVRLAGLIVPRLRALLPALTAAVSRPSGLSVSLGASLLLNAGYVAAFISSLYAIGAHPPLLATTMVFLLGSFVGSAAPTPGGLGAVEAALAAGLASIGVPAGEAIPAVVIYRLATFWIPIPVGWLAYIGLQRTGTL